VIFEKHQAESTLMHSLCIARPIGISLTFTSYRSKLWGK